MRLTLGTLLVSLALTVGVSPAFARPRSKAKKRAPVVVTTGTRENNLIPPVGYKGTNEGAQGRKNATEDAARAAEGPSPDFRRY